MSRRLGYGRPVLRSPGLEASTGPRGFIPRTRRAMVIALLALPPASIAGPVVGRVLAEIVTKVLN